MSDPTESLRIELVKVRTERDKLRMEMQDALNTIDDLVRRIQRLETGREVLE